MNKFISIDAHISNKQHLKVLNVCKKFFAELKLNYFCYQRHYPDNSYTLLSSHTDLADYFFSEKDVYQNTWLYESHFATLKSGVLLWDLAKKYNTPGQDKISNTIGSELKLKHGIDIVDKQPGYCDIFCFSSEDVAIYKYPLGYFKSFIFYFRQECHSLMKSSWEEKIILPKNELKTLDVPILELSNKLDFDGFNKLKINKYYLSEKDEDVYLTKKEWLCLSYLLNGGTAKRIGGVLGVSHRTVEHHIASIKSKLSCSSLQEIYGVFLNNTILL